MLATNISHALGLRLHQPPGNLAQRMEANARKAEQVLGCYERPTRYAQPNADVAQLHIGFSGILLEQRLDKDIGDRCRHIVDIQALLDAYRGTPNIERIGMGDCHLVLKAQTSRFAFWGDDWLPRLAAPTDAAEALIAAVGASGAAVQTAVKGPTEKGPGGRP